MRSEDRVFGLLIDANPIPRIDDLDLRVVGGLHYLEELEDESTDTPELYAGRRQAKNHRPHRGGWLAAALAIIAGTAALVLMNLSLQQDLAGPDPLDNSHLTGTWDFVLPPAQRELVLQDFEGLVGPASEVVMRVGMKDHEYWQGFLFDGELFLGDSGSLEVGDGVVTLTGGQGGIRSTYRWDVDQNQVTFTWLEQCWISSAGDDCTDDRARMAQDDPLTIPLWENSFTKISEDTTFRLGRQSNRTTLGN